jgi:hypothetical protein
VVEESLEDIDLPPTDQSCPDFDYMEPLNRPATNLGSDLTEVTEEQSGWGESGDPEVGMPSPP